VVWACPDRLSWHDDERDVTWNADDLERLRRVEVYPGRVTGAVRYDDYDYDYDHATLNTANGGSAVFIREPNNMVGNCAIP
jgi:hypothetical protein